MKIQDFCDMNKFEQIMSNWAKSTGLATVAVGSDGKYISDCYNFTEFCIDLTRGCPEGKKRCEKCDREGHGVYPCHAGLVDFGIPITLEKELSGCAYPGRGIVIGRSEDGSKAVTAYFIMGRSANSRNRVFVEDGEGIRTEAFDPSKLEDPSLIIYAPVRILGKKTIVTNGDQTDTVYDLMSSGKTFEESLRTREFEPDAPNFTPRISGLMTVDDGKYDYAMSILKSHNGNPDQCDRYTFTYDAPVAGEGHFIHTYMNDGNPLPSFEGEPAWVKIDGDIDTFTNMIWNNLNEDNKVSLFVRFIDIKTGKYETRIINKNK